MNVVERAFGLVKEAGRKAFVPYIMAGDGGLESLTDRLILLEKFGATAIEVGVPFSDPVADGPTIQRAGIRALKGGTTLKGIIAELEKAREAVSVPIILMTYLNPIYAYGIKSFVKDIQRAGVGGCIIPDLPLEEESIIAPKLEEAEVELIRLVTPTTPIERIEQIASKGSGFLYAVTVKGITGARNGFDEELFSFLQKTKEVSSIPVLAGFGISSPEQISHLTQYCDGVVVGSKIIELFNNNDLKEMKELMSALNHSSKMA
ncbi:tryptophan synthase subunit alpha [Neobacillus niacini]|uniref:tryptophan synthase subunit alpha n=1 Tax=Neobacillus niacini TaxID=86668 RepID=UPI0021CB8431|nr:tryptophan synthase subunit alpha [Neobacillus niacini]MCM3767869.1 tryptophan synthase subunit alpha [Neobacillus niacini]